MSATKENQIGNVAVYLSHETQRSVSVKLRKMKATKRFTASAIKNYRLSNTTYQVSFDTLEEAKQHVVSERELHPRSKKFNPIIVDTLTKESINGLY